MGTKAPFTVATSSLLLLTASLGASFEAVAGSSPSLFGFILTSTMLATVGGVLGAVGVVGGAAFGSYQLRKKRVRELQEKEDNASTAKAIEALDSRIYGGKRQSYDKLQSNLKSIFERDPTFDADKFCKTAERLFVQLQLARNKGNLIELKPHLSDGLYRDLTAQLTIDDVHQRRIITRDILIRQCAIVGVELGDDFDAIHVAIISRLKALDAQSFLLATPEKVDEKMGKLRPIECAETWTFRRRPTPDSDRKGSLLDGTCPMCAAKIPTNGSSSCSSCGAILNSGASDWVITEIVETPEFRIPDAPRTAPEGFARLQALDPSINSHILEDRARLVFWARLEALAQNQPYAFGRYCHPQALMQMSSSLDGCGVAIPRVLGCHVHLCLVVFDVDCERAWFRVRWKELRKNPSGKGNIDVADIQLMQLSRRNGHTTLSRNGLSTARCPVCGSEVGALDAQCPTCKKSVLDDWCFVEQISPETFQARQRAAKANLSALGDRIGAIIDPWDRRRAFMMMVAAARADGHVSDQERNLLQMCAERWQLDPILLKAFLATPQNDISNIQPKNAEEARLFFRALAAAAYADGKIDDAEMKLLKMMAKHLKLAPDEDYEIIKSLGPQRTYVG